MASRTAGNTATKGAALEALDFIDQARTLLAFMDGLSDHAEEISLSGDSMIGFKWAMLDICDRLQKAREALREVVYGSQKQTAE